MHTLMLSLFPRKGQGIVSSQLSVAHLSLPLGQIWPKLLKGSKYFCFLSLSHKELMKASFPEENRLKIN